MSQNAQNRTDQAAGDFFHSKTWKVILTVWLSLFGVAALCVCSTLALSALGFVVPLLGILGLGATGR